MLFVRLFLPNSYLFISKNYLFIFHLHCNIFIYLEKIKKINKNVIFFVNFLLIYDFFLFFYMIFYFVFIRQINPLEEDKKISMKLSCKKIYKIKTFMKI